MPKLSWNFLRRVTDTVRRSVEGPQGLAFIPAATLGAFWLGGEPALILLALASPAVLVLLRSEAPPATAPAALRDPVTGLVDRTAFVARLDGILAEAEAGGRKSACIVLEIDDGAELAHRHGHEVADAALARIADRLQAKLREGELVARVGSHRFAVALAPVRNLDLESCLQLAARLQGAVEEPIAVLGASVNVTATVGFCLSTRRPGDQGPAGAGFFEAATMALEEALAKGPMTIRAFSKSLAEQAERRRRLAGDLARALDEEAIEAWFQPQISTETGRITGFEALARWFHPELGEITPETFLPMVERIGQIERLGQIMMNRALAALARWREAGLPVERVGINFSQTELRNPRLLERVEWALERHDIPPGQVVIEILESVIGRHADDIVARNIRRLAALGCVIDLDDFGTGNTSIAALRRFPIARLKIDRSFIAGADSDPEKQRMIAAILIMADQLGLETVAEGIETRGEHAIAAQLGCSHVQGFAIAHPMPFEKTLDWVRRHEAARISPPRLGSRAG